MVSLQCMYGFFLFFFYLCFSILGVRLWFASFASLRTVNTVVILLSSQTHTHTHTHTHTRTLAHTHTHTLWARIPEIQVRIPSRAMGTFFPHTVSSIVRHSLTHTHTHAYTHTYTHTGARTHTHARTNTHTHTHTRIYTHTHTHTGARTHTHARTNTHTHTHQADLFLRQCSSLRRFTSIAIISITLPIGVEGSSKR